MNFLCITIFILGCALVTRIIEYIECHSVLSTIGKYSKLKGRCAETGEQLTVLMMHNGVKTVSGEHFIKCTTVFATAPEIKFLSGAILASEPELVDAVTNNCSGSNLRRGDSLYINSLCDVFGCDELDITIPRENRAVIVISNGKVSAETMKIICE